MDRQVTLNDKTTFVTRVVKLCKEGKLGAAYDLYKKEGPEEWLKGSKSIKMYLTEYLLSEKGIHQKFPLALYNIPDDYKKVLENELNPLIQSDVPMIGTAVNSLSVQCPSGIGKTQHLINLLISEGIPFIVVRNKEDLRKLEIGITKVIIFDGYD